MSQSGSWLPQTGPGSIVETLTGNSGGPVGPNSGNINILGTGNITVNGFPASNDLIISETSPSAITFDGNSGSATPDAFGTISIVGSGGVLTSAAGNTVTITAPASSITLTGDTGGALTGNAFTIYAHNSTQNSGSSVSISGSGTTLTLNVTDAISNTIIGRQAGNATHTGSSNTGLGFQAFEFLTTGISNVGIGTEVLLSLGIGSYNCAVGQASLQGITSGNYNTAIGCYSGQGYVTGTEASNISIGYNTAGTSGQSNVLRIGTGTGVGPGNLNKAFISGIDGVNVGSVATVVTESGNQLGTAVLTAGTNISITPGANTITIAATGPDAFVWTVVTAGAQAIAPFNGYIANNGGTLVLTLPALSAVGDIYRVTGINNNSGWQIAQNIGQTIYIGNEQTTTGATGYLQSTQTRDSVEIVCVIANSAYNVLSSIGNILIN